MRDLFATQTRTVAAGQAVSCSAKETRRLRVISGRVWVTMEGVAQDYWLFGGDAIRVAPGVLTVIEADGVDSSVELTVVRSESALWKAGRRLLRLLRRRREALSRHTLATAEAACKSRGQSREGAINRC